MASRLSTADNSLLHVYTRLFDDDALTDLRRMTEADSDALNAEIDALPADADEAARQSLAEKLAPVIAQQLVDYPWLNDPGAHLARSESGSRHVTLETFVEAVVTLYHPAQIDVLNRAGALAHEQLRRTRPAGADATGPLTD